MRSIIESLMDLDPLTQSRESCIEIQEQLLAEIRKRELFLGNKNLTDLAGNRLIPREYVKLRQRKIKEMNQYTERYRLYGRQLNEQTQSSTSTKGDIYGSFAGPGEALPGGGL